MRHGRAKAARKTIQFFERTIGIKSPYHIILDGTFLVAVVTYQIPIKDRFDKLVQHGNTYVLHITDTTINEINQLCDIAKSQKKLDKLSILHNAIEWAKENCQIISLKNKNTTDMNHTFPSLDQCYNLCNQTSSETQLSEAAIDIVRVTLAHAFPTGIDDQKQDDKQQQTEQTTNETSQSTKRQDNNRTTGSNRSRQHQPYFCASQDEELLDMLRHSGKVPIIRLARNSVILLEQRSKYAQIDDVQIEKQKWKSNTIVSESEQNVLKVLKEKQKVERKIENEHIVQRKRKQERELYGSDALKGSEYDKRKRAKKAKGPNPLSQKKKTTKKN